LNAQTNKLEYAFKRNGIPYRIIGGTRFFDRLEIKDMLSYLWVILNPEDELRLLRIINSPPRGIGEKTLAVAQALAVSEGRPLFTVIKDANNYPALSKSAVHLRAFAALIDELRAMAEELPLDALYDALVDKSGYVRALEQKPSDENNARIENVGELKSNMISYIRETGEAQLAGFLDEVALYTDIDNSDDGTNSVVLMTMHSAKGLEFDNVYIAGVEEGIFPGIRSIGEAEEMEEERRLCYVGITRARKKLTLICARQRMLFGRTSANSPSRFVHEIPEELLERRESPANDAFGQGETRTRYGGYAGISTGRARAPEKPKRDYFGSGPPSVSSPDAGYSVGDTIIHTAFGEGEIAEMTPMGGDYFITIRFGEQDRKFMLRAAAAYMRKHEGAGKDKRNVSG
jgi:DNA helicase-2/ATP-dependent DNA helicase PcrA